MKLTSSAFQNQGSMPLRYSSEGQDISPPLAWSDVPEATREFALICEDPDAEQKPGREHPLVHWLIYNISPSVSSLPDGLPPLDSLELPVVANQGKNSLGKIGYEGPLPPPGDKAHRYNFKLYALNAELGIKAGATCHELLYAIQGHVLATAELTGTYQRRSTKKVA